MKKLHFLYILCALTVVALTTTCQDDADRFGDNTTAQGIRVMGDLSTDADSRTTYTIGESSVTCAWAAGDTIALFSSSQTTPVLYVAKTSGTTTEFAPIGDAISVNDDETVYAWYPYQTSTSQTYPNVSLPNIRNQYYNGGEMPADLDFVYASGQVSDGELSLSFNHLFAFLHLRIAADWLSGYLGVYVYCDSSGSDESVAYRDGATYDLTTETMTAYGTTIRCYIDSTDVAAADNAIDCYVAIRPMSAGNHFKISKIVSSSSVTAMTKKNVPDAGILAGHVYTTTLGEIDDEDERDILMEFYKATDGDNWTDNTNWCTDAKLSEWYGVTISNGHVTRLDLDENNLSGEIPESIGNLTNLQNLYLHNNNLSGEIPESIGNLACLQWLNLAYNSLSGEIPESIGNLTNLIEIYLRNNELTGKIPETIGNLGLLTNLYLYRNNLTGEIPESIGNLTNLERLGLSYNNLTGEIPESIGNLSNLLWIYLCGNALTGEIPESIGNLTNLEVFQYSSGSLSGEIPESIGNLTNLQTLTLYHHNLTGNLPASMANLSSLTSINLLYNKLSGVVPTEIVNCDWWAKLGYSTILTQQSGYRLTLPEDYEVYTSTDYSEDGEVYTLQTHSQGSGMKFFIVGEAFSDRLIADGTYKEYVDLTYEAMFSEEPFASYKDYFDVYYVNVVSKNESIGGDIAFGTTYESSSGTIDLSYSLVEDYIGNLSESGGSVANTVAIVIVNGDNNAARSRTMFRNDGFAAAYCITGDDDDDFKALVHHEALGHGFASLADEYEEYSSTFTGASSLSSYQTNYNWYLNVDTTNDTSSVLWSYYLTDENYNAEGLGIYEGAYLYSYGVYRPRETSIMRYNTGGFNAPSRQEIYRRIITRSGGTYSFEDFLEYDLVNCKAYASGLKTRSAGKTYKGLRGASPIMVVIDK